ncbi:MAG: DUF4402 domain-containing protein [Desulforegulaceae bacterium]|nr:DUF4402 domain-containing protein [Desulforegulaceae bacterium]
MNLKKIFFQNFLCFLFILLPLFIPLQAFSASVTLDATATIEAAALTATQQNSLNFGTIIISDQESTIRINASAGAATPSVESGTASVSGGGSGLIYVTTNIDSNVTIVYPASATIANAANQLTINNISANSTPSPLNAVTGTNNEIHVGGILTVPASQTAATYTGTMSITVNY